MSEIIRLPSDFVKGKRYHDSLLESSTISRDFAQREMAGHAPGAARYYEARSHGER